jgi:hypothetical protein
VCTKTGRVARAPPIHRRRHGQDDRRPVDRRRLDRDQLVRHESSILRFVFGHSIVLACLVGVLVMLQAYVFTGMIVQ